MNCLNLNINERGNEIMATLYELTGQFLDIYNLELDEETKLDTLDSIE